MFRAIAIALIGAFIGVAQADVFHLKSGGQIRGRIIQNNGDRVTIRLQYGTYTLNKSDIVSTDKETESPPIEESKKSPTQAPRIPAWSTVLEKLAPREWAKNLEQIPATVIDVGVMRHVPYTSYRCGEDIEINIYGDPDYPAGVEIGLYRKLLKNKDMKMRCRELIASIVSADADKRIVRNLNLDQTSVENSGVTFEVTPETAEDAYGGWWISMYDEKALNGTRASPAEIKEITQSTQEKAAPASPTAPPDDATDDSPAWTSSDLARARPAAPPPAGSASSGSSSGSGTKTVVSSGGGSSGGRVYVRGYYRKNGTYVRPHTRKAPRRR